jgi:uncharacterized phiE125 gp8 family phage protein
VEPLTIAEVLTHLRIDAAGQEPVPAAPTVALANPAVAGNVDDGAHRYRVTFVTADGETDGGAISDVVTVSDKTVNGKVEVTAIPVGGSAVTQRKLYRTAAAGSAYLLLATIANNTATTYTDNIADASLGAGIPTSNTTSDPEINRLIVAARMKAEEETNRAICTQTWDWMLSDNERLRLGSGEHLRSPKPPLQSVTHLKYIDTDGAEQTWAASNYTVTAPAGSHAEEGTVTLAYGVSFPSVRDVVNNVTIRFVAGYGLAAAVPLLLKQAMLLLIGHWYANREAVVITGRGSVVAEMPQAADWIFSDFRGVTW